MRIRYLSTAADVIDAIGGLRLQRLTGRSSQSITNCRAKGYFPSNTYLVMQRELQRIRCRAPDKLWQMIEACAA